MKPVAIDMDAVAAPPPARTRCNHYAATVEPFTDFNGAPMARYTCPCGAVWETPLTGAAHFYDSSGTR